MRRADGDLDEWESDTVSRQDAVALWGRKNPYDASPKRAAKLLRDLAYGRKRIPTAAERGRSW